VLGIVEREAAAKDIYPANFSTDHRITGTSVIARLAPIGNPRVHRITGLKPK
jgi:hypothetical protein